MLNTLTRWVRLLFIIDALLLVPVLFLAWWFAPSLAFTPPVATASAATQIAGAPVVNIGNASGFAIDVRAGIPRMLWFVVAGGLVLAGAPLAWRRIKRRRTSNAPAPSIFPNYLQLRATSRISPSMWAWARRGAVFGLLAYAAILFTAPATGLLLWWRLTVPLLPLIFLFAPGLWRNVCPLAASNQLPRQLDFSRALTPPKWLKDYGFAIGVVAFFAFATSRKWLFNTNGPATAVLLLGALVAAFVGGYFFKGKSGWCSSICPLYPVQRLYNRTPFITLANAHCTPCVGCTKNCYDFNPHSAYFADVYDDDKRYASYRKFFAAAMPGFVAAYFTLPDPTTLGAIVLMYAKFVLYVGASVGGFSLIDTFWHGATSKLTALYGALAFNLFYWFGLPGWFNAVGNLIHVPSPDILPRSMQVLLLGLTFVWGARTFRREPLFLREFKSNDETKIDFAAEQAVQAEIKFMPTGIAATANGGRTLLEIAATNRQPLDAACSTGTCGADPVLILDGAENLSPTTNAEKQILALLGLGPNCRLACMARVRGPVTVLLPPASTARHLLPAPPPAPSTTPTAAPAESIAPALPQNQNEIVFMPDETRAPLQPGKTLLEIAENANQPIEAGCRMGVCGADPILVLSGMENLNPIGNDEKNTLERLGLGANCRLACMSRVKGPVTLSLQTKGATNKSTTTTPPTVKKYDRNIKRVVIIGNGVAGITAADYVRRNHPDCEIHVISKEKHHFYNRIGIMRLIYGRSAMSGLYLQPEAWYDEHQITCWLNTHVTHINRGHKQVHLATGEHLTYDRLILANGSSSFVPAIPGFGMPGTFVLREAEEAMEIRAYAQQHHAKSAVIAGGGLLGLEAAYALHQLGLTVWVLERGDWLLRRQLDERAGHILKQRLEAMGLIIETRAETAAIEGEERVTQIKLASGQTLPCDVFLVAAGIQPNVELARRAGLKVNRGILVDKKMRTNAPGIFAAGDVCEFEHEVPGLWHVAVEQAKVAALNALGGDAVYQPSVPVAMLKVVGVDVLSVGKFQAHAKTDSEIVFADPDESGYRKLVLAHNKLVGAILIGHSADAPVLTAAVKANLDVRSWRKTLETGDWKILAERAG